MPSLKTLSKIGEVVGNTLADLGRSMRAYHGFRLGGGPTCAQAGP